ncbi:MAG: hypothetical protein ACTHNW_09325 [Mucilaginibacter sp.]
MKRYLSYLFIFIFTGFALKTNAQNVKVEAKVDRVSVPMGDQTTLRLIAHVPAKSEIQFPVIADSIGKIRIVKMSADSTADKDDPNTQVISHNYTITGFNAGTYTIPAYTFHTKTGAYTTDSLVVQFKPVAVDTTKAFYDIKQPLAVDYNWWDWIKDHWIWVVSGLVLILVVIYITWYVSRRYEKKPIFQAVKVVLTTDQIAMNKLNELRAKNLWQNGDVKTFYIELTDILREYLEKRYAIQALEQTTEEIFASLKPKQLPADASGKLKDILVLADLVKFAKEKPVGPENEQSMTNAVDFVQQTKEQIKPVEKEELPK